MQALYHPHSVRYSWLHSRCQQLYHFGHDRESGPELVPCVCGFPQPRRPHVRHRSHILNGRHPISSSCIQRHRAPTIHSSHRFRRSVVREHQYDSVCIQMHTSTRRRRGRVVCAALPHRIGVHLGWSCCPKCFPRAHARPCMIMHEDLQGGTNPNIALV